MLIALLAVLGVDLIVIVVLASLVIGRRRWLKRQPGEFAGAVRVASGAVQSLSPKWRRGSGRWVSDVLVWEKGPFLFRTVLIPADSVVGERAAEGEVKRLGDDAVVVELVSGGARIEVAASSDHRGLVKGPFTGELEPPPAAADRPPAGL